MAFERELRKTLIVSGGGRGAAAIAEQLPADGYAPPVTAVSGSEARRRLAEETYELVIVNAPLADEYGTELALHAAGTYDCGVILLVRAEQLDEIAWRVEEAGVLVTPKPLSRALFAQALRFAAASRGRLRRAESENRQLREKLDEIRVVARAKCLLSAYLRMSEAQAHRYIEKQAMDRRVTRREIAEDILRTYEG